MISTHTIPSLSGTFGIHTRLALNPKMPKEPSSPSHTNARTEKHCAKIETDILRNNKGQRTTRGHKTLGAKWLFKLSATHQVWRNWTGK